MEDNGSDLAVVLGGVAHMLGLCPCGSDEQDGTADSESEPAVAEDVVVAEAEPVEKTVRREWKLERARYLTDKTANMRAAVVEYEAELSDLRQVLAEDEVEWEQGSYYQKRADYAVWCCVEYHNGFRGKALLTRWCGVCEKVHDKVFYNNTTPAVEGYKKVS